MLEVCVRMLEPLEDTPIGILTISIGVETVQGTAGIVCTELQMLLSIAICIDSQMAMTIWK